MKTRKKRDSKKEEKGEREWMLMDFTIVYNLLSFASHISKVYRLLARRRYPKMEKERKIGRWVTNGKLMKLEDNKKEDNQASVGIPVKKWKTLEYAELRSDV